ncbi:MAG TPA: ABC transporter substrate-binding protein, partial [Syntrophales bacterium]|nr:ABC transporter substrate-binding protein [Syntrophales bacterium]
KYAEGVYASGPRDVSKNSLAIAAVEAHRKAYRAEPGAFFLNAYAATMALLNAIEKAGAIDYIKIGRALKTYSVDTPLGKIRFNDKGDAIGVGFSMYQVRKGAFVEVR